MGRGGGGGGEIEGEHGVIAVSKQAVSHTKIGLKCI